MFIESLRLRKFRTLKEAAEKDKLFPLKEKDGQLEITNIDIKRKVSAAMEISKATSCQVVFINMDDIDDKVHVSINRVSDNNWEKVENFAKLFVKFLVIKNIEIH